MSKEEMIMINRLELEKIRKENYNQALKDAKEGVKHILSLYEYAHQCNKLDKLFKDLEKGLK